MLVLRRAFVSFAAGRLLSFPYGWPEAAVPSRRLSMIVAQKPTQSLVASDWPLALASPWPRNQQDVALPLVVPLGMEVFDIVNQCSPQRPLAEQDHPGQALLRD